MSVKYQKDYTMETGKVAYVIQGSQVFYTGEYVEWLELQLQKKENMQGDTHGKSK